MLAAHKRPEVLSALASQEFDLTVIGGGITGAGIALDAASRGLKVALIEKGDFASGTSSKSTKLIHGGLRYLKQLEIQLVREVGRERAIVHRLAPHLVTSEKMLLPLIKEGTYGQMATSLGLWVYDILAGVEGSDKRKMLDKEETIGKEPLLRTDILVGGGYYAEYRTDDARLTIENIKTSYQYDALSANYVKAIDFNYEEGSVRGVQCEDVLTGDQFDIHSKYIISAAGPWVDKLRKKDKSLSGKHLFLSKGVHIVVPHDRFPLKQSVYFDIPDGRMMFAIPRHRTTYIGTTDTPYEGDLNHIPIDLEDVTYLLDATNQMFPEANLTVSDVESSWAGLRPLIHEEGKSASEMSRKDEIFESETGLISIAGGKLTGYRKMAERVVDVVAERFQREHNRSLPGTQTKKIPLHGGPFNDGKAVRRYWEGIAERIKPLGLSPYHAIYLVSNYGKETERILQQWDTWKTDDPELTLTRVEAWYTREYELAQTALDFFNRRSGRLYFNLPSIRPSLPVILDDFQQALGWSEQRKQQEAKAVDAAIKHVSTFKPAANPQAS